MVRKYIVLPDLRRYLSSLPLVFMLAGVRDRVVHTGQHTWLEGWEFMTSFEEKKALLGKVLLATIRTSVGEAISVVCVAGMLHVEFAKSLF